MPQNTQGMCFILQFKKDQWVALSQPAPAFHTIHYSLYLISLYFSVSANSESHHCLKSLSSQAGSCLKI